MIQREADASSLWSAEETVSIWVNWRTWVLQACDPEEEAVWIWVIQRKRPLQACDQTKETVSIWVSWWSWAMLPLQPDKAKSIWVMFSSQAWSVRNVEFEPGWCCLFDFSNLVMFSSQACFCPGTLMNVKFLMSDYEKLTLLFLLIISFLRSKKDNKK